MWRHFSGIIGDANGVHKGGIVNGYDANIYAVHHDSRKTYLSQKLWEKATGGKLQRGSFHNWFEYYKTLFNCNTKKYKNIFCDEAR